VVAAPADAGSEVPKEIYHLIREHRNDGLNWGAYRFRELVAEGAITAAGVCRLLWLAALPGLCRLWKTRCGQLSGAKAQSAVTIVEQPLRGLLPML
jgi:hypothetical protein